MSDSSTNAEIGGSIVVRGLVRRGHDDLRVVPVIALSPDSHLTMDDDGLAMRGNAVTDDLADAYVEVRGVWVDRGTISVDTIDTVSEHAAVVSPPPSLGARVDLELPPVVDEPIGDLAAALSAAESLVENNAALHFVMVDNADHFAVVVAATDSARIEAELRPILGSHLVVVDSQNTPTMLRVADELLAQEDSVDNLLMTGESMSPSGEYRVVGIVRHRTPALNAAPSSALDVRAWIHPQESKEIA